MWLDGYFVVLSVGVSHVSLFVVISTLVFAIPLSAIHHPDVRLARLSVVHHEILSALFHNAVFRSVWLDKVHPISHQLISLIAAELTPSSSS